MAKNWIKSAIKRPGSLRRAAKKIGAIKKSGNINLGKMSRSAKSTTMKRKIALARTLKGLHH